MNILVVDDQPVVREVHRKLAESAVGGANVHVAGELEAALASARKTSMDLVLLDLGLPGCAGIDALKRFREAFPRSKVVVISSNEDDQVIADALDAGAIGYVVKTVRPAAVAAALRLIADGATCAERADSAGIRWRDLR